MDMSFRSVFIALVISFGLVLGAYLINRQRPAFDTDQPNEAFVKATGKCAECHTRQQYSVVHEYELSVHAKKGINCLDCHQQVSGQQQMEHHGFVLSKALTSANCKGCHPTQYEQFAHSRHAAPSWAAVYGEKGSKEHPLTAEQVALGEKFHPGSCQRPPNALVAAEGQPAVRSGCVSCHGVGRPNADGSVGTCTSCHSRHTASVELARLPATCAQCHLGPDHSQIEIYTESKHGVMFNAQRKMLNLAAPPQKLTTRDMFVPTCATCHMSGVNGLNVTHDPSERLSYSLFAEVSKPRPHYVRAQAAMKSVCLQCHTQPLVDRVYKEAEEVVSSTNDKIQLVKDVVEGLRKDGLLKGRPFENPIDFAYFDLWHYYGRTAKHGAFMGGADFIQWHGNYPILKHTVEIRQAAQKMRSSHARQK
jgi:hypothetical protein